MDELIQHCIRQLAFDGDLGSKVERLKAFVIDFYTHSSQPQNVDDDFCALVWSLIVRHPNVRVGLVPPGVTTEVWIAPQHNARRKAKEQGHNLDAKATLLPIPADAQGWTLVQLQNNYGDSLRIGIDPDEICAMVTGSHVRSPKLSPMVYTALQIVTRGRENGVSVVELGQKSTYDQKTCFYLVRQLVALDLVFKVRRGGVGTHFVIHKYFFERSPEWQAIRDEESRAEQSEKQAEPVDDVDEDAGADMLALNFSPIDARHLSSYPLVRQRVVNLLKTSKNNIHASNNMLVRIGFAHPTKTDRRFFQNRIREMITARVVERVLAPSHKKGSSSLIKCLRLVSSVNRPQEEDTTTGIIAQTPNAKDDENDEDSTDGVRQNVTVHKQIVDLLEQADVQGMTVVELSTKLSNFDRRTIELFLARAEKDFPPPHLSDLKVVSLMETNGRGRCNRYYTLAAYRKLFAKEKLDQSTAQYSDVNFSLVGGFMDLNPELLYSSETDMRAYQDQLLGNKKGSGKPGRLKKSADTPSAIYAKGGGKSRRKSEATTQPNGDGDDEGESVSARPKKQGRPSKVDKVAAEAEAAQAAESLDFRPGTPMDADSEVVEHAEPPPKKRGRPPKADKVAASQAVADVPREVMEVEQEVEVAPTKRGRKPQSGKVVDPAPTDDAAVGETEVEEVVQPPPKKRGRPSKADKLAALAAASASQAAASRPSNTSFRQKARISPCKTLKTILSQAHSHLVIQSRVNVSHLRRENELCRVLHEMGGIVNTHSRDLFDAHFGLIAKLAEQGEPTSIPPGARTDKRTMNMTLNRLEAQGRIKQLKTFIPSYTGVSRPACVAYFPDTSEEKLTSFLNELTRQYKLPPKPSATANIETVTNISTDHAPAPRDPLPLQLLQLDHPGDNMDERWSKNDARAQQLFEYGDETVRDVLLTERTTLAQNYGFIVPKMSRIRHFHLGTLEVLENRVSSPYIVSLEKRIVNVPFYHHDISLAFYLSVIATTSGSEELAQFYNSEVGRNALVRNLPAELHQFLQIGRSRPRARTLDLLEILRALEVVTPLRPSISSFPHVTCSANGDHPTAFDVAPLDGWSPNTPLIAPAYWQFNESAPVYLWALSGGTTPPFYKSVDISTSQSASKYWQVLQNASLDKAVFSGHDSSASRLPDLGPNAVTIARSLRRAASWDSNYVLTWHQSRYLKRFVSSTGFTPLDSEDRDEKLRHMSWILSAPVEAIEHFYREKHSEFTRDLEKVQRRKTKQQKPDKQVQDNAAAKATLARKATEARQAKEASWESMVERVIPNSIDGNLAWSISQLKQRFMVSLVQDMQYWENQVRDAAREVLPPIRHIAAPPVLAPSAPPPVVALSHEKSIQDLIEWQKSTLPPLPDDSGPKSKKGKRKQSTEEEPKDAEKMRTRRRFLWTKDFDELACDAGAIIRARCRNSRITYVAMHQVFPAVPRNTVRQRLANLRENPGTEAYLNRLEARWYDLWCQQRGTPQLPDDDPGSPTNFDLMKHIEFLRRYIDKNALRVGLSEVKETVDNVTILQSSIDDLARLYHVMEPTNNGPRWDFMFSAVVEDGREKRMAREALTLDSDPFNFQIVNKDIVVAESALKMVLGTSNENYDPESGSFVLQSLREDSVSAATKGLLGRGVLSKIVRDPQKVKPGRLLKISETNQNALGGSVPLDTYQDAVALEELSVEDWTTWRPWPLLSSDGDTAAMASLVSDNKVDFKFDLSQSRAARKQIDWNSKKADDDMIEIEVSVRFHSVAGAFEDEADAPSPSRTEHVQDDAIEIEHEAEEGRCCRKLIFAGLIDCKACLASTWSILEMGLDEHGRSIAKQILDLARASGEDGVPKTTLMQHIGNGDDTTRNVLQRLTEAPIPLVYWVGYGSSILVAAQHCNPWTVLISKEPLCRVFPRRWIDVKGHKMSDIWAAGLRAVVGMVLYKPGISQVSFVITFCYTGFYMPASERASVETAICL
ncbi:hypothetical protein FISHEDRAFT_35427 [Fistulina hepatica ATCC 64428]|uniref:Transcription factor tau subunit sfc3/Tfc3 C-terminal domain-containing protein n=1 Tax=Fistulina hepatica ATCC 64428 TaxID=1128425 RepID=A0A0D7AND5_9AGAR|nr:hypothetical protein FISHEDRAFT_35427 [Fistulina hepatica ATCC 64428]